MTRPFAVPEARRQEEPRRLASLRATLAEHGRHLIGSLAGIGVSQALGVATGLVLARGLGPEDRGAFAAILLWPTIVLTIGEFGIGASLTYFAAKHRGTTRSLVGLSRRFALVQSLILLPVAVIVAYVGLNRGQISPLGAGLLLAAVMLPTSLLGRYTAAILQGRLLIRPYYLIRLSMYVTNAVGFTALYALSRLTLWTAALTFITGLCVQAIVSLILARRFLSTGTPPEAGLAGEPADGEPSPRALLGYGVRSMPATMAPIESLALDQILIALVLGTRDLGLYVAALALVNLPRMAAFAIGLAGTPITARTQGSQRDGAIWRLFAISAIGLAVMTGGLVAAAPLLIPVLFGREYADALAATQLLLLGALPVGLRIVLSDCLRGAGRAGLVSLVEMSSWPFMIAAVFLGARAGLSGVAAALIVVQVATLAAQILLWQRAARRERRRTTGHAPMLEVARGN